MIFNMILPESLSFGMIRNESGLRGKDSSKYMCGAHNKYPADPKKNRRRAPAVLREQIPDRSKGKQRKGNQI